MYTDQEWEEFIRSSKEENHPNELFKAVFDNNIHAIKEIFIRNPEFDINFKKSLVDTTALHLASFRGHLVAMEILITQRADINSSNFMGFTPIFAAVQSKNIEAVAILINAGANLQHQSIEKVNLLTFAAEHSTKEITGLIETAIKNPGKKLELTIVDVNIQTPIDSAIDNQNIDILKFLFERGNLKGCTRFYDLWIAIDKQLNSLDTALQIITKNVLKEKNRNAYEFYEFPIMYSTNNNASSTELLKLTKLPIKDVFQLREIQLFPNNEVIITKKKIASREEKELENAWDALCKKYSKLSKDDRDELGSSFSYAAKTNNVLALKHYQSKGNNIDSTLGIQKRTAIMHAAIAGSLDAVKHLFESDAMVYIRDKKGRNLLYLTIEAKQNAVLIFLLSVIKFSTAELNYLLIYSAEHGYTDIAETLLDNGAKIDCTDKIGNSALHYTASRGDMATVQLLVKRNANVNLSTNKICETDFYTGSNPPLFLAATHGHTSVAEYLVRNGSDINARNESGMTPIAIAICFDRFETTKKLYELGAMIDTNVLKGYFSIFALACRKSSPDIINFLIEHKANVNEVISDRSWLLSTLIMSRITDSNKESTLLGIETLLQNGAFINEKAPNGESAYEVARATKQKDVIALFEKYLNIRKSGKSIKTLVVPDSINDRSSPEVVVAYTKKHVLSMIMQNTPIKNLLDNVDHTNRQYTLPTEILTKRNQLQSINISVPKLKKQTDILCKGLISDLLIWFNDNKYPDRFFIQAAEFIRNQPHHCDITTIRIYCNVALILLDIAETTDQIKPSKTVNNPEAEKLVLYYMALTS